MLAASALLALGVSVGIGATAANAANPSTDFTFTHNGAAATITGYVGTSTTVDIPATLTNSTGTYNVTTIGAGAFEELYIASVTMPTSVTSIGANAFAYDWALTSMSIGTAVTTIGAWAFAGNPLDSMTIPDSVTTIGDGAFYDEPQLAAVTLGSAVATVGQNAFTGDPLRKVLARGRVFQVYAASSPTPSFDAAGLVIYVSPSMGGFPIPTWQGYATAKIAVPTVSALSIASGPLAGGTLTTITGTGFTGATAVKFGATSATKFTVFSDTVLAAVAPAGSGSVAVSVTNLGGTSRTDEPNPEATDAYLYSDFGFTTVQRQAIITSYSGPAGVVVVPHEFEDGNGDFHTSAIAANAFASKGLTSVTIPDGTQTIGASAFAHNSLVSVSFGAGLQEIDANAFLANSLSAVTIPGSVTTILSQAFAQNSPRLAVTFTGNAPATVSSTSFGTAANAGINFPAAASGFSTPTWDGYPSVAVYPVPDVAGLSPASVPEVGGTSTVITGDGFFGATAVSFGGAAATSFSVVSDSEIDAVVPSGSGTVDVTVTTPGGTSPTTSDDQLVYLAPVTMIFDTRGGSTISSQSITYGLVGTVPSDPTRTGYVFDGWFTDADGTTPFDFSAGVAVDVTAYAHWLELPALTPGALTAGKVGIAYVGSITAGGPASTGYKLTAGALPAGLKLNALTGAITGKPLATGSSSFTVSVTNTVGISAADYSLQITLADKTLSVHTNKKFVLAGNTVTLTLTGFAAHEPYTVTLDGVTLASGAASKSGKATQVVTLPVDTADGAASLLVTGSTASREGHASVTVLAATAALTFTLTPDAVVQCDKSLMIVVRGFAAGEPVSVTFRGHRVSKTSVVATAAGSYTVKISAGSSIGDQTIVATGAFAGRTASTSVSVVKTI